MRKKIEVCCTSTFKNPSNISGSLNKLWADVINTLESTDSAKYITRYNEDKLRQAYPNSAEFEASDK